MRLEHEGYCLRTPVRALPTGMLPLSERPLPSDVAVPKAVIFRQQMEQRQQVCGPCDDLLFERSHHEKTAFTEKSQPLVLLEVV